MKAVPRKQLWRCRYICSDHRGCLIFLALPVPVIVLTMNWIDGTALKNLPAGVTINEFKINPELPEGLGFNTATGAITGKSLVSNKNIAAVAENVKRDASFLCVF